MSTYSSRSESSRSEAGTRARHAAKVAILGKRDVGKTSLISRYTKGTWSNFMPATVGLAFQQKEVTVDGHDVRLDIWDMAGQQRFDSLAGLAFQNVVAAILVCDCTDEESFEEMQLWAQKVQTHQQQPLIFAIACSKMDLEVTGRAISRESIAAYAASLGAPVFETSAKEDVQVSELFEEVARRLVRSRAREVGERKLGSPAVQKRLARIELCRTHWLYGSTALQPQLWARGGVEGKIERQLAKLPQEVREIIERSPSSCC